MLRGRVTRTLALRRLKNFTGVVKSCVMAKRFALVMAVLLALAGLAPGVRAQVLDQGLAGSFITPFPEGDLYQIQVVGDWWADGMLQGLKEGMAAEPGTRIASQNFRIQSLFRSAFESEVEELDQLNARSHFHIAVVMIGMSDRVSVRVPGQRQRASVGSAEWRTAYAARVDQLMKGLKQRGTAVYWVSLPILRRGDANEDAQLMNEIIRERALINGLRFIDVYAGFADDAGQFNDYGPDLTGKNKRLRDRDGIGFTGTGYRKLAHFVEREIRRDLAQARSERAIPLAGAEPEQARVNPEKVAAAAEAAKAAAEAAEERGAREREGGAAGPVTPSSAATELKADNGRIALRSLAADGSEQIVTLPIVRPPLSASVVAIVSRRQLSASNAPGAQTLVEFAPGGLPLISTITPANDRNLVRQRLSPTQLPYFQVLVKGQRLTPKEGRADDFTWPRPEPIVLPAAVETEPEPELAPGEVPLPVRPRGRGRR